jgi:hypothetical protein
VHYRNFDGKIGIYFFLPDREKSATIYKSEELILTFGEVLIFSGLSIFCFGIFLFLTEKLSQKKK